MHLLLPPRGLWGYTLIVASRRGTSLCRHNAASSPLAFAKAFSLSPATSLAKPDWTPRGTGYEGRRKENKWPHGWAQNYRGRCALPLEGRRFLHSLRGGECAGHFGGKGDDKDKREACLELLGLTCGACVAKVERALLSVDGVVEASVNLSTRQARVVTVLNEGLTPSASELAKIVGSTGFQARVLWDTARENTRVVLDVQGLKCGGCVSKGEAALAAVEGVREASINLATNTATVTLVDSAGGPVSSTTPADLVEALSSRGYPSKVFRVSSQWGNVESEALSEDDRVTPAQRHEREAAESERRVHVSMLLLAVSAVTHLGHHSHHLLPHGLSFEALGSLPAGWFDWFQAGVATAALAGPGWNLLKSGLAALRRLSPDMNSLVSTGVLTVYLSSVAALLNPSLGLTAAFHEPVMLLGAVMLGRSLEARQRLRAARGLQRLFDVRPDQVRLVDAEGGVTEVQAASVRVGDTVEVLPSDRFSVDGVVLTGRTAADESSLTGEPALIPKGPGDSVRAGTSSAGDGGAVRVRATATGAQSVLGSVIALVEDAQARKPPVQRLADAIAGKFTWLVFATSASTLLFWGALSPSVLGVTPANAPAALSGVLGDGQGGGAWALGMRLAVDVCLVACPCSLGLATPTAIMVGTGVAAERGILLKGADVLETARKATAVVFDKTGTLTTGKSTITGVISLDEAWHADRVLEVAAAVERGCRHPLAEAVVSAAEKGLPEKTPLDASGLRTVPGMGASAQVKLYGSESKTTEIHVGSPRYIREVVPIGAAHADPLVQRLLFVEGAEEFDSHEQSSALSHEVAQRLSEGQTAIVVAAEEKPVGLLFSSDTVRPAAAAAVTSLVQRGLTVKVASGDRREAVWTAAAAAGVPREDATWAATPADKASLVRSMQAQGDIVMVVGDGVNDAPALAAADVGVAMRGGTGSAMDAADIVLMRDDVCAAGMAVDISALTMRKVRTNLMWALGYNAVAIPVAAGVFLPGWGLMLSPAMAGAIMSCSSVAVVTNSLLLRRALKRKLAPPAVREKRQQ